MSIQGINGSIPFPAAARQAYAGGGQVITPPQAKGPEAIESRERIDQLVAGQVPSPVNRGEGFDLDTAKGTSEPPSLPLYTRAADQVEAATQVAIGRRIDLNG
jgi:hypothetical protein